MRSMDPGPLPGMRDSVPCLSCSARGSRIPSMSVAVRRKARARYGSPPWICSRSAISKNTAATAALSRLVGLERGHHHHRREGARHVEPHVTRARPQGRDLLEHALLRLVAEALEVDEPVLLTRVFELADARHVELLPERADLLRPEALEPAHLEEAARDPGLELREERGRAARGDVVDDCEHRHAHAFHRHEALPRERPVEGAEVPGDPGEPLRVQRVVEELGRECEAVERLPHGAPVELQGGRGHRRSPVMRGPRLSQRALATACAAADGSSRSPEDTSIWIESTAGPASSTSLPVRRE